MNLESTIELARFHSPLKNGAIDEQSMEIRTDPLLGHKAVFNPGLEDKVEILFPRTDEKYLVERSEATKKSCFLCNGRWRTAAPRYEDSLVPGGRIQKGRAVLFPNLFPLSSIHAVVMLGDEHFRRLNQFEPSLLGDGFKVALELVKRCEKVMPGIKYFTINANYMPPAGASVMHPHLQLLGSTLPGTHHQKLLSRSRAWFEREKACYFRELVEQEEQGPRMIARQGSGCWLAAYAPLGGHEIQCIWPEKASFLDFEDRDVDDLACGLSAMLSTYHDLGLSTFNFSMFGARTNSEGRDKGGNSESDYFKCMLRLVNRQNMVPDHRTDDYFFQKLLENEIILRKPGELAGLAREHFKDAMG
ncbi:MAG: hypothetical protein GXP49_04850 [Deltaproteobacteria bacterium]|nr:hypothetical protein [Deltaproteobacteria bacterium]